MFSYQKAIFFTLFLIDSSIAFAQKDITPSYAKFFIDTARQYSIDDVVSDSDSLLTYQKPLEALNFQYLDKPAWFKINFEGIDKRQFLVINNAHIDSLHVYKQSYDNEIDHYLTGDHLPFDTREFSFNLFIISVDPGVQNIYLRAHTEGMLSLPIEVFGQKELISAINTHNTSTHVYIGFSLVIIILIVILYFRLRDNYYLYYLLHLVAILIIMCINQGVLFQWFWRGTPGINEFNAVFYTFLFFSLLFSQKFLELKHNNRLLYQVFLIFYTAFGLAFIIGVFKAYNTSIRLTAILTALSPILFIVTGTISYIKTKERSSLYYLLGWSGYSIMLAVTILGTYSLMPLNDFVQNSILFGHSFEIIFLFMAVTDKIEHLKSEKSQADTMVVSLLREQEETLKNQNKILEEKVAERTRQIESKNVELENTKQEIESQNVELMRHQEALVTQRDQLEAQKEIIESQIRKLNEINDKLEQKVKERTEDLRRSNKELVLQNSQLEQYAYITAHNLRAPVTRLKGLINLFELTTTQDVNSQEMLDHVNKAVVDMEEVLNDLNAILEIKNLAGSNRETVDLNKIISKIKHRLDDKIKGSKASIRLNLQVDQLYSVGIYLESILYNLIYNALKYKSADRSPKIDIDAYSKNEHIILEVCDNGVGIDLKHNKHKIFGLYQRFHDHIHGKGMGLFMVKNQVEALNGTIELDSEVGVGTSFKITLPGN